MMTTRRWWITGAVTVTVLAAIAAAVFIWVVPGRSDSDCAAVRQLLDSNAAHDQAIIAQSDPDNPSETPVSDYRAQATQLKGFADEIADPGLARHAEKVAELADQTVGVVVESRDDANQAPVPGPPAWVQKYADLNSQFKTELAELVAVCPA